MNTTKEWLIVKWFNVKKNFEIKRQIFFNEFICVICLYACNDVMCVTKVYTKKCFIENKQDDLVNRKLQKNVVIVLIPNCRRSLILTKIFYLLKFINVFSFPFKVTNRFIHFILQIY